jgi:uncharacterized protein YlaI
MISQNKCFECDSTYFIQNHHVIPKSLGGNRTIPLCADCHSKIHNRNLMNMQTLAIQARKKKPVMGGRPKKIKLSFSEEDKIKKKTESIKKLENEIKEINSKLDLENKVKEIYNDKTIVVKDACKILGISRATYYRHVKIYENKTNINN